MRERIAGANIFVERSMCNTLATKVFMLSHEFRIPMVLKKGRKQQEQLKVRHCSNKEICLETNISVLRYEFMPPRVATKSFYLDYQAIISAIVVGAGHPGKIFNAECLVLHLPHSNRSCLCVSHGFRTKKSLRKRKKFQSIACRQRP